MKKLILPVLVLMLMLAGCGSELKISGDRLKLSLGQEQTLNVTGAELSDITFSSMDPNIASVDENGVVKGLGDGVTVITAKAENSYDHIGVVVGTGVARYVDENGNIVSSLEGSPMDEAAISGESDITALALSLVGGGSEDVTIGTDRTYEIKITRTPADSFDKITLRISDPSVARVEGNTLIGVARGKATLTATAPNGISAEMIVRVK